jgi:hypothetical protein
VVKDRGENCCLRIDAESGEKAMSERPLYDLPENRRAEEGRRRFHLGPWYDGSSRLSIGPPKISHKALFRKRIPEQILQSWSSLLMIACFREVTILMRRGTT